MKVHLASRDVLTIAGLRQLLKSCAFVSISGTSSGHVATLSAVTATAPDVLVLSSVDEQEIGALATAARLLTGTLKIVVVADEALAHQLVVESSLRLEAVLVKDGEHLEDIGAVLRIVHRGGHVTSGTPGPHQAVAGRRVVAPQVVSRFLSLSDREKRVMQKLAQGRTNAQIAQPLHVSVATIKVDLAHIMEVMRATSRVDLAVQAARCGIIDDHLEILGTDTLEEGTAEEGSSVEADITGD